MKQTYDPTRKMLLNPIFFQTNLKIAKLPVSIGPLQGLQLLKLHENQLPIGLPKNTPPLKSKIAYNFL